MYNKGGYVDSPNKQGNLMNSPADGTKKRNSPLIPVTIRQLLNAQQTTPDVDDFYMANGQSLGRFYLVAQITSDVVEMSNNLNYKVDDGTGTIEVRIWVDQDGTDYASQKKHEWFLGVYVRIVGNLRAFSNIRRVVADHSLIPIVDYNELTHHFLEVVHYHVKTNGLKKGESNNFLSMKSDNNQQTYSSPYSKQQVQIVTSNNSLNELQQQINNLVSMNQGDRGFAIQDIVNTLTQDNLGDEVSIRKVVQYLIDEGHLYNTIDEEHVAVTIEF